MLASLKLAAVKRELDKLKVKDAYEKIAQLVIQEIKLHEDQHYNWDG